MKPQLYLHIGQPKSATTSIQRFLLDNRNFLMRQGYIYPKASLQLQAHHPLGNIFSTSPLDWIEVQPFPKLKADLMREIRMSGCNKVIMSTESLCYPGVQPERIKSAFDEFDVKILLTLRRQEEWIESALRDDIKTGAVTGSDILGYVANRRQALDYSLQVSRWSMFFGNENIILNTFEPGRNVVPVEASFLNSVGANFSEVMRTTPPLNDRLSRDCLEFLRMTSQSRRIDARYFTYFDILAAYSKLHPDPVEYRYIIPREIRLKIKEDHSASNAEIAREFLGRESLFREGLSIEEAPWSPYPGLDAKTAVLIGEFLANYFIKK